MITSHIVMEKHVIIISMEFGHFSFVYSLHCISGLNLKKNVKSSLTGHITSCYRSPLPTPVHKAEDCFVYSTDVLSKASSLIWHSAPCLPSRAFETLTRLIPQGVALWQPPCASSMLSLVCLLTNLSPSHPDSQFHTEL